MSASKTVTAGRARLSPDRERVLAWDGCINVRDLGGLPTEDGRETRFGIVVRADAIRGLTDKGIKALADYGVRLAIDLRADDEVAEDAHRDLRIPVVRIPLVPWEIAALKDDWPSMREGYLALLEHFRPQFARAIAVIATEPGPVVVHCQGGRDRTGLVVALALSLAGVDPETIAADHARSDMSWAPFVDTWLAEAPSEVERERRRRVTEPAGRTMVEVLAELERLYGGPRSYLVDAGASSEDLDMLVVRLVG